MPVFTPDEIRRHPRSWTLFQGGAISLFHRREILDATTAELAAAGYRVNEVVCDATIDGPRLAIQIACALAVTHGERGTGNGEPGERAPAGSSLNRDALNDLLHDLNFENATGWVLVLSHFDSFQEREPVYAQDILDILATHHRRHLLRGNRLLALVQADDPRFDERLNPVGGYIPLWNPIEWPRANRPEP